MFFEDGPLHVGLDVVLISFDAISEVNMDFTLTIRLNQHWQVMTKHFVEVYIHHTNI